MVVLGLVVAHGLSLVVMSGAYSLLWRVGFSSHWLPYRRAQFLGAWASVVVTYRPSFSMACGVFRAQFLGAWALVVVTYSPSFSMACGVFLNQG